MVFLRSILLQKACCACFLIELPFLGLFFRFAYLFFKLTTVSLYSISRFLCYSIALVFWTMNLRKLHKK